MIVIFGDSDEVDEFTVGPFYTAEDAYAGARELEKFSHPDAIIVVTRVMSLESAMKKTQKEALARMGF